MAIPPGQCGHIHFSPPLPYAKKQLFECAPQGNLIKCIITYKDAFWRNKGMAGQVLSTGAATDNAKGAHPILCTFDVTTPRGNPALAAFLHNGQWIDATQEERRDIVIKDLCRFFGDEAANYLDYADKIWNDESYSGGCPTAIIPAGNMEAFTHIREPFKLIHFAATEAATVWPGYMCGAVQSGLRAANEVIWHCRPEAVNEEMLKDTIYDKDFELLTVPQPETYGSAGKNQWPRRIVFGAKDTIYDKDFESLTVPQPETYGSAGKNQWPRRIVFGAVLILGILAFSKKYKLSHMARLFRPLEKVYYEWHIGKKWPF
uniref:Amine oxidase n=1 Tax=Ascaris lumbricoides TaxID=6252 RepID=A0A0M3IGZ0_ASCLU